MHDFPSHPTSHIPSPPPSLPHPLPPTLPPSPPSFPPPPFSFFCLPSFPSSYLYIPHPHPHLHLIHIPKITPITHNSRNSRIVNEQMPLFELQFTSLQNGGFPTTAFPEPFHGAAHFFFPFCFLLGMLMWGVFFVIFWRIEDGLVWFCLVWLVWEERGGFLGGWLIDWLIGIRDWDQGDFCVDD